MKRKLERVFFATIAVVGVLGILIVAEKSAAGPPVASASGHGTLLVLDEDGNTVKRQFSLSPRKDADGEVNGKAVLHNPAFSGENGNNYQLHVDISCMQVFGNTVVFGGSTRRTNDPNLVDAVYFSVQDNGEPGRGRDKISSVFFFDDDPDTEGDPQDCVLLGPGDLPLNTIDSGNIQVK